MKTLIQIVLVAVVVGGVSAGGSYFLRPKLAAVTPDVAATVVDPKVTEEAAKTDGDKSASDLQAHRDDAGDAQSSPSLHDDQTHSTTKEPVQTGSTAAGRDLPVAVRPPYVPDSDEAGLLITSLRMRTHAAEVAERSLAERQAGLKLIFDDLRVEQTLAAKLRQRVLEELAESKRFVDETLLTTDGERETFRREHDESRILAETALRAAQDEQDGLRKQLDGLRAAKEEQESLRKPLDTPRSSSTTANNGTGTTDTSGSPAEIGNLKKLTAVYDSMPPENVATVCQQLVKKGRTAAVVALLNGMKERQTAKVLAMIADADPTLAADLTERLKSLKTATTPPP